MKAGLILQILMVGFNDFLDIDQVEDIQMIKDKIARWKGIVSRVRGKLIKMIKEVNL